MHERRQPQFAILAAACVGLVASIAAAGNTSDADRSQDLDRRIAALEERVERLSRDPRADLMTQQRAQEIRSLVECTLADAETRTSLKSNPRVFYNNGFSLRSDDNRFRLNFNGELQVRYLFNHQDNSPTDDDRGGFEIRRLYLGISGFVFDPSWRYTITPGFFSDGHFSVQDAYIKKTLFDGVDVMAGRFRPQFLKEQVISNRYQLLVERSLVAREFGERYGEGAQVLWESPHVRTGAAFIADRDGFNDVATWRVSGRVETLLAGEWDQLRDLTSWPDQKPTVALGAGVRYDESNPVGPFVRDTYVIGFTVDGLIEVGGVSLMAAFVGNFPGVTGPDQPHLNQYGMVVQGGVFVAKNWELVARYEWGDADGLAEDLSVVSLGLIRYFHRQTLKWTTDVGYGLNEVDEFWASDTLGWRTDAPGESGQIVLRSQIQLLF